MKQLILALSIFALFSCNGSSDSDEKSGGVGDTVAACDATTVEEFFAAMAGDFDLIAVDTLALREPPVPTTDDTFTVDEVYTLTFGKDLTLSIDTDNGGDTLTFGDSADDVIDFSSDNARYVSMHKNDVAVLTRLDCVEEEPSFFVTVKHVPDGVDFWWRLDQETAEAAAE